jgi:transposase-like protein
MPTKNPTDPILDSARLAIHDEARAVEFFEECRWGASPKCARCDSANVYAMKKEDGTRNDDYRWRCRECNQMYTVRTNMVFEESRLPMRVWAFAFWKACSSKKGVSALQIRRECEISYKSALRVMHSVRTAMAELDAPPLGGPGKTVEGDETYVGGKPRNRGLRFGNKRGAGTKKTPVVAIVERGGDVRFRMVDRVTSATLSAALWENVDLRSRLITDEYRPWIQGGKAFDGGHETVHHRSREYARGPIHSNTVEGVFSLLKRGMYGTFHSVSKTYLPRYLAEFEFRHNHRFEGDGPRTVYAIRAAMGKRCPYSTRTA